MASLKSGQRTRSAWTDLALGAVTVVFHLLVYDRALIMLDEGQVASYARRILHGQVLYRDMYTGIFPGIYYITAGLFSVFGNDILVTRIAQVVVNVATAICLWRIGARLMRWQWALLAPLTYVALISLGFPVYVMFAYSSVALLAALAAYLALQAYVDTAQLRFGVTCGCLLAACALTKQNYGALAALAVLLGYLWLRPVSPLRGKPAMIGLLPVVASGAIVSTMILMYFLVAGAGERFFHYTVATLFESQLDAFNQPLPPIFSDLPTHDPKFTFLYLPGVLFDYLVRRETVLGFAVTEPLRSAAVRAVYGGAYLAMLGGVIAAFVRRRPLGLESRMAQALVVFALLMFLGLFPSAIFSHLIAVSPPLLLLAALAASRIHQGLTDHALAGRLFSVGIAVALIAALTLSVKVGLDLRRWNSEPLGLRYASVRVPVDQAELLRESVEFLQECAAPGETIFAAPDLPVLHFLADRWNATPYDMTIPGDVDEQLLIERLTEAGTRCVLYNPKMYIHFGEFGDIFPDLVAYLESQFVREREIRSGRRLWYGLKRSAAAHDTAVPVRRLPL